VQEFYDNFWAEDAPLGLEKFGEVVGAFNFKSTKWQKMEYGQE
jgi:hypothetical protein